jgi:hypothetical protein
LGQLASRIRGELVDLDRSVARVERAWGRVQRAGDDRDLFLDSVALNLHGFYAGLEKLFELTCRHVDGDVPAGPGWHEELIKQMAMDLEGTRPAVLSTESAQRLDEYRRFRHLVRNVYATNLLPERVVCLVTALPHTWAVLRSELTAFAEFLGAAA